MYFRRFFHNSQVVPFYVNQAINSKHSLLSTLRKRTGYAIANCKRALELNNNDLDKVHKT